ncbi:MAG: GNAT family N-acetyltransferase [Defluviitaleaceae bacterium]|nr:GNAT family N-acetyltransferase [Defluviitaleaceae bacterium]
MITLKPVTRYNFENVIELEVADDQKGFLVSNAACLAGAYVEVIAEDGEEVVTLAVCDGDVVVGFIMAIYGEGDCYLDTLMIDKRFQSRGFGRAAMEIFVQHVKVRNDATHIHLRYSQGNQAARIFFANLGFAETGQLFRNEVVAQLVF